ncbi:MAG: aldo/keto reductase [Eubacterium sp.]|nr:aldo/keto reductase [Eubacterium sp.]
MILNETFTLANGVKIPKIGLGTWQIPDGDDTYNSVMFALKNGYRHIDTAKAYGNEASVGRAIKDFGIAREDIFVTTKLPAECKGYDIAKKCFEESLSDLDLGYIDLYLIHAPWPWDKMGMDCTEGNIESWKALEEVYESGKARAIGISNFAPEHIQPILDNCKVVPMVDQISFHVGNRQEHIVSKCKENNIQLMAYSPLATGGLVNDEYVAKIAEKYNATIPQICVRYCIQKGAVAIPKSTKEERIISNVQVDFEISDEDMAYLDRK